MSSRNDEVRVRHMFDYGWREAILLAEKLLRSVCPRVVVVGYASA